MLLVVFGLFFLWLQSKKETNAPGARPGPTSETNPDVAPERPRTVAEEAVHQSQLLMNSWRNNTDGGYR